MKISRIIKGLIVIFIIQSCASSVNITQLTDEGEKAYQAGNYETALTNWEKIIENKGKKTKGEVYVGAGKSALALNQTEKATAYLETARQNQYSSPELYEYLAKVYNSIDNLSKEITALETYCEKYPQGNHINEIHGRLLETYVESENWDLALKLWPKMEANTQSDAHLLGQYLIVNKNLENTEECDKLAKQITGLDASNVTAMAYYAEKYYWLAENLYVKEMTAYKNKRTNSQYKKLLKALDEVWPTFRKSRDYYLKLYKIDPKPEYANYLGNIYTRFDDKEKADYYYKRAK